MAPSWRTATGSISSNVSIPKPTLGTNYNLCSYQDQVRIGSKLYRCRALAVPRSVLSREVRVYANSSSINVTRNPRSRLSRCQGSAACSLNGSLYIIGGWHASTENTNKVEKYDPVKDEWESVASMNERRYRPGRWATSRLVE